MENKIKILMVGLDVSGKTTILSELKLGEIATTIPALGFYVETVEDKNVKFTVWDIVGVPRFRPLRRYYFQSLVFCKKQDLPSAMQVCEITQRFGLSALQGRQWHKRGPCATSGAGLHEGLDRFCSTLSSVKR
ncbi:hypothetical protein AAHC03_016352 [Spirometra sp. Aus1]